MAAGAAAWGLRCRAPEPALPVPGPAPRGQVWRTAALWAIGSRVFLVAFGWACVRLLGLETALADIWNRWDAPHYVDIIRYGYTADQSRGDLWLFIVFYPLYPLVSWLVKPLFGGSALVAAMAVSWVSLVGACVGLYRLAEEDGGPEQGWRAVRLLLLMPAAVFLGAPYTESLFLLLSVFCLWCIRRGRWAWAGSLGFLAALTRNMGVLLAVPFAVELLAKQDALRHPGRVFTRAFWRSAGPALPWVLGMPLGLVGYLLLNWHVYGDPFVFLQIQDAHWGQHMQPFWQTVRTTWDNLLTEVNGQTNAFLWIPQMAGMAAALALLPVLVRRLRPAEGAYLVVYLIVALSPSWLLSFHRYWMGAAPVMLALASLTRRAWADVLVSSLLGALMLYLAYGYLTGFMVV